VFIGIASAAAVAQKAEPLRIKFAKGKTSATLTNKLSGDQEMDYVFGAAKGQTVTLKVTSKAAGDLFDFSIQGDGFEFTTEEEAYSEYGFEAPETGDYIVYVRKLPNKRPASARFYLVLTIR
jgi:hypothetical protein